MPRILTASELRHPLPSLRRFDTAGFEGGKIDAHDASAAPVGGKPHLTVTIKEFPYSVLRNEPSSRVQGLQNRVTGKAFAAGAG
jgi:hypothetical protein